MTVTYMTPAEFAAMVHVHVNTVRRWAREGQVDAEKFAGSIRIRVEAGRCLNPSSPMGEICERIQGHPGLHYDHLGYSWGEEVEAAKKAAEAAAQIAYEAVKENLTAAGDSFGMGPEWVELISTDVRAAAYSRAYHQALKP